MEFVEGDNLTELKTQQPGGCFDPEQILGWLEQLCAVLDYAHREKRIIHRDLKPRNVMLTKAGKIKVADFGIAAVLSDSMSKHSMEGKVSGTLSYMPRRPEWARRGLRAEDRGGRGGHGGGNGPGGAAAGALPGAHRRRARGRGACRVGDEPEFRAVGGGRSRRDRAERPGHRTRTDCEAAAGALRGAAGREGRR
jgi:hypothetical protein